MSSARPILLFVDDEPSVLDGIRRLLRSGHEWQLEFATSGQEALHLLSQHEVDVAVVDMRMPVMSGFELLETIAERYPYTVRLALSGESSEFSIIHAVGPVQQYLAKPCDAETLKRAISRALSISKLIPRGKHQQFISHLQSLSPLPDEYNKLVLELQSVEPSFRNIEQILARNVALAAKVLQAANSVLFGLRREVTSLSQAIAILGLTTMNQLFLGSKVFSSLPVSPDKAGSLASIETHCISVATISRVVAKELEVDAALAETAFTAGLLHDIGKMLIIELLPNERRIIEYSQSHADASLELALELELLGTTHAQLGAYLLGLWGFPESLIEAVGWHHQPVQAKKSGLTAALIVHITNAIAHAKSAPVRVWDLLDTDYLKKYKLISLVEKWLTEAGSYQAGGT
jgi:putative nucleotidyltransferase with HDIG domain